MEKTSKKSPRVSKPTRFFCIVLALLVLFSILIWGFQTGWGYVSIRRLTITGDEAENVSMLLYLPKNATQENPAPLVLISHGRSNQAHSDDTFALELARRGYIVIEPDLNGSGASDTNSLGDREGYKPQAIEVTQFAQTLDYIKGDEIIVVGYSAGVGTSIAVAEAFPEDVKSIVTISSTSPTTSSLDGFNYCFIKADADQYNYDRIGTEEAFAAEYQNRFGLADPIESGGTYDIGDGNVFSYTVTRAIHHSNSISGQAVTALLDFMTTVHTAPNFIDPANQVWGWQQFFSLCAAVTFMVFLAALVGLLLQNPYFAAIKNPMPVNKGLRGKKLASKIALDLIIPIVLFIPVSIIGYNATNKYIIFRSRNLNGIMLWLIALGVISTIGIILQYRKKKSEDGKIALSEFALGADDAYKLNWLVIWRSLFLGIIVMTICIFWINTLEDLLGINYMFWNLCTFTRVTVGRFFRAIPYAFCIFFAMLTANIGMCTARRFADTKNEKKDMIISVASNALISGMTLGLLVLIQYGGCYLGGTGKLPLNFLLDIVPESLRSAGTTDLGCLDFAFGYCFMMGGTTGVCTYLFRKAGNIWPGVISCTLFAAVFTTAAFRMMA